MIHIMGGIAKTAIEMPQRARELRDNQELLVQAGELASLGELPTGIVHELDHPLNNIGLFDHLSARREQPSIAVDCGAIPETLVESELFGHERIAFTGTNQRKESRFQIAKGGSLFWMRSPIFNCLCKQGLRVLQEKQVHALGGKQPLQVSAGIVAASNVELQQAVQEGAFRMDLYHGLNEFTILLSSRRHRDPVLPRLKKDTLTSHGTGDFDL